MRLYESSDTVRVGDAPVGLLLLSNGTVICKSEYRCSDGKCDCTIVETGERYCGEGDEALCHPLVVR
jgi:hypothetical protein